MQFQAGDRVRDLRNNVQGTIVRCGQTIARVVFDGQETPVARFIRDLQGTEATKTYTVLDLDKEDEDGYVIGEGFTSLVAARISVRMARPCAYAIYEVNSETQARVRIEHCEPSGSADARVRQGLGEE